MAKKGSEIMIPDETVMNKIYLIRDKKVMLDRDLAQLHRARSSHALKKTFRD